MPVELATATPLGPEPILAAVFGVPELVPQLDPDLANTAWPGGWPGLSPHASAYKLQHDRLGGRKQKRQTKKSQKFPQNFFKKPPLRDENKPQALNTHREKIRKGETDHPFLKLEALGDHHEGLLPFVGIPPLVEPAGHTQKEIVTLLLPLHALIALVLTRVFIVEQERECVRPCAPEAVLIALLATPVGVAPMSTEHVESESSPETITASEAQLAGRFGDSVEFNGGRFPRVCGCEVGWGGAWGRADMWLSRMTMTPAAASAPTTVSSTKSALIGLCPVMVGFAVSALAGHTAKSAIRHSASPLRLCKCAVGGVCKWGVYRRGTQLRVVFGVHSIGSVRTISTENGSRTQLKPKPATCSGGGSSGQGVGRSGWMGGSQLQLRPQGLNLRMRRAGGVDAGSIVIPARRCDRLAVCRGHRRQNPSGQTQPS